MRAKWRFPSQATAKTRRKGESFGGADSASNVLEAMAKKEEQTFI